MFIESIKKMSWMFLVQLFMYPVQLLFIPYLISQIGYKQYGIYILYLAIFNYVIAFVDFGMGVSLQSSFGSLDKKQKQEKLSLIFGLKYVIFLLSLVILILISFLTEIEGYKIFLVSGWGLFAIYSSDFFYLAEFLNKQYFFRQLFQKIIFICFVLILFIFDKSVDNILIALSLSYLFSILQTLYILKKHDYQLSPIFNVKEFIKLLRENFSFLLNSFASTGLSTVNVLVITKFLGNSLAGNFSILESLNRVALSLISSMESVLYPLFSKERSSSQVFFFGKLIVIIYPLISVFIFVFRAFIFDFFKVSIDLTSVLTIMLLTLCIDSFSRHIGYNTLGAIGKGKLVNISNIVGLGSYFIFYGILSYYVEHSLLLVAYNYCAVVTFIFVIRLYYNIKFRKIILK